MYNVTQIGKDCTIASYFFQFWCSFQSNRKTTLSEIDYFKPQFYTFLFYKKSFYKKMSLKNPKTLRKC